MRRLTALLLALVAIIGLAASSAPSAAADGPIGNGVDSLCRNSILGPISSGELCDDIGDAAQKKVDEEWKEVWDSILGDVILSSEDVAKWVMKKTLTVALQGPSLDLEATNLWGKNATLAGMLVWLGLVIAAGGMMWQFGKMAITGQAKHAGRAMAGWAENMLLSAVGVGIFALLLTLGDALTDGLVDATFNDQAAYDRIISVLVPNSKSIANPILMSGVVGILCLVGFIQLVTIFLRQSAIPIICLLLPIAGGGRAGGDATRQWAPKLITTGLVVITYKPMLAIIICTGFAEFGHARTLAEWLRGVATLILGIIAPGPLMKIFAPFGEVVGGGLAAGGASGAVSAAAGYMAGGGKDSGGGGEAPASAVSHAQHVEKTMGKQGDGGSDGSDAQAQADRNEAAARIPAQATSETAPAAAAGEAAPVATATGPGAAAIMVLDGVNDAVQGASSQIGGGESR
ncbi:hypothetical protein [Streptomyces sp. NPDC058745]|uniref:hypothetical protein n=1 Tax=Streptomyces sp. NPDC058745 TaxID=3346621 RepID=UPI0036B21A34